jgi:hypothetical protein
MANLDGHAGQKFEITWRQGRLSNRVGVLSADLGECWGGADILCWTWFEAQCLRG